MKKFVASNGAKVVLRDYRHFDAVSVSTVDKTYDLAGNHTRALREFFQAEADARLGRWRWPEDPDYVVYPVEEGTGVWIVNEPEAGAILSDSRNSGRSDEAGYYAAARAYFDAHPEPRPWHDAKDGETWALTVDGVDGAWAFRMHEWERICDGYLLRGAPGSGAISAGRRIWPEAVSS